MVDSLNAALTEIDTLTKYNAASKTSGLLGGDTTSRAVRSQLQAAAVPGDGTVAGRTSASRPTASGKLVFDQTAFDEAPTPRTPRASRRGLTSDGTGFLARAQNAVAEAASDSTTASLTTAITGRTTPSDDSTTASRPGTCDWSCDGPRSLASSPPSRSR